MAKTEFTGNGILQMIFYIMLSIFKLQWRNFPITWLSSNFWFNGLILFILLISIIWVESQFLSLGATGLRWQLVHYHDVIMSSMASQITCLTIVYSTVYSRKSKKTSNLLSLVFVWGIHRWLINSPHKWPKTRKKFPFDDVIMQYECDTK